MHMAELREKDGQDFDTVVRAFGDANGEEVVKKIAETLAEGLNHPGA